MDPLELYVRLRKAGYRYPYSDLAAELEISRVAVWNECNGTPISQRIRDHICAKLGLKESDVFPTRKSIARVA